MQKIDKEMTKDRFDAVLQLLDREDRLTNSRMTWYLTIQGFIIAGVALTCGKEFAFTSDRGLIIAMLSSLGIAISLFVFISVRRARNAKKKVAQKWKDWKYEGSVDCDLFPEPTGDTSRWSRLTPGQSVPLILIAFWFAVITVANRTIPFAVGWIATIIILILVRFIGKYRSKQSVWRFTNIHGIVYDLDGTIIDSSNVHVDAWQDAGKKYGVKITPQFIEYQKGRTNEEAAEYLLEPLNKVAILKDFVRAKIDYANQHVAESKYFEDFTLVYKRLCQRGIRVWVCTSSPEQFCLKVYKKYSQLKALSKRTVWREKYQNGKDEGLQQAFKEMEVEPKDGIYIGDAPSDWTAAKEVGCRFVCYRNLAIERHCELLSLLP